MHLDASVDRTTSPTPLHDAHLGDFSLPESPGEVQMNLSARSRGENVFAKPPLSHGQLVDRLQERGLHMPERDRALRYLRHLGYYRLSPYTIPFQQDRSRHTFHPGTTFDDVLDL